MPLLTKQQLATELGLKVGGVESLTRKRKTPVFKVSRRCVRYDLHKVLEALSKFEVKSVV
jgi:hypothetical protein